MTTITITEALAELKTLQKRIEKKRTAVGPYLLRQSVIMDPHAFTGNGGIEGGSREFVRRERQAIADLMRRVIAIRVAIQRKNHKVSVTVEGETRTLAEWLTWRREVSEGAKKFLQSMHDGITRVRADIVKKGGVVAEDASIEMRNVVVNVDETELLKEIEHMETVLGALDGQLSLKNATVTIEVSD